MATPIKRRLVSPTLLITGAVLLGSGGGSPLARAADRAPGEGLLTLTGHRDDVKSVAVSPDGKWLASGSRGQDGDDLGASDPQGGSHLAGP